MSVSSHPAWGLSGWWNRTFHRFHWGAPVWVLVGWPEDSLILWGREMMEPFGISLCCSSNQVRSWFGRKSAQKHSQPWNLGERPYGFSPESSQTPWPGGTGCHALVPWCLSQASGLQAGWSCVWYSLGPLLSFRKERAAERRSWWCNGAILCQVLPIHGG